ncbi:MAG: hypothetical protein K9N46_01435 [Candidatus Marinimicrobia bacterium]|nr:hypothetical protein [Candidatus Neomarinimicrobiota bacterium]MCF7827861.1 hypothetical protein [Candidatus Neomarinimicrobiota bacterium]MCF7879384.1 hypothetical protein [Candidatus Neomarinimicrobiota bacterium]
MARRYSLTFLLTILLILPLISIEANTGYHALRQPLYARAVGMNGAFTGQAGDASAVNWNPAGLFSIDGLSGQISYQKHLVDVNATELLSAFPVWKGGLAVGLYYWDYGNFDQRNSQGAIIGDPVSAYEGWLSAGYGMEISKDISIGASVQLFQRDYADNRSTVLFYSAGVQRYFPQQDLRIGFALSRWGRVLDSWLESPEPYPNQIMAGLTKQLAHLPLQLFMDGEYDIHTEGFRGKVGGEFTITESENLFLRFGLTTDRFDQQTEVVGADFFAGTSFGFGVRVSPIQIDYGTQTFGGAGMIHSVTVRWGM